MNTAFQNIPNKPLIDWEYFANIARFSYCYDSDNKTIVLVNNSIDTDSNEYHAVESVLVFCRKHIRLLEGARIGNYSPDELLNELTNARSASGASLTFPFAVEYFHPDTAEYFLSEWHTKMEASRVLDHLTGKTMLTDPTEALLIDGFLSDLSAVVTEYLNKQTAVDITRTHWLFKAQQLEALGSLPERDYNFAAMFGFKTFFVDQPQENTVTTKTFVPLDERAYVDWPELVNELNLLVKLRNEIEESKDRSFIGRLGTMSENYYTLRKAIAGSPEATVLFKDCFLSPDKGSIAVTEMFRVFNTNHFKSLVFDLCAPSSATYFLPKGLTYSEEALLNISTDLTIVDGSVKNPNNSSSNQLVRAISDLAISYLELKNGEYTFYYLCYLLSDKVQWPDGFNFWDVLRYMLDGPTLELFYTAILRKPANDVEKNDGSSFQILEDNTRTADVVVATEGEQVVRVDHDIDGRMSIAPEILPIAKVLSSYGLGDVNQTIDYIAIINNRAEVLMAQLGSLTDKKVAFPNNFSNPWDKVNTVSQITRINNMRLAYDCTAISHFIASDIGCFWTYSKSVDVSLDNVGVTAKRLFLIYRDWILYQFITKTFDCDHPDVTIKKIADFV